MLKEARIKKNLTQSALAEKLGVTYQAVSNWERGGSLR
ncbi:MAG: helix-turn-helix transcriptional regulator [Oscillospiraceae bacterium]|nr:helix-turn-helix transcriptional regulator [Oscillospiraceae bacterium]